MIEQLQSDMITAMKNKEKEKLIVIRTVKAAIDLEHINTKREKNDELAMDVINKQIKMRREANVEFAKANRDDLVIKNEEEINILLNYLPEQLSNEKVNEIINNIFLEVNPSSNKDMGKIMGLATAKLKGVANMKEVSNIIKEKLSNL